jgi:hypothetical protein
VYHAADSTKFWIITEADRSSTNVELNISGLMWTRFKCGVGSELLGRMRRLWCDNSTFRRGLGPCGR